MTTTGVRLQPSNLESKYVTECIETTETKDGERFEETTRKGIVAASDRA